VRSLDGRVGLARGRGRPQPRPAVYPSYLAQGGDWGGMVSPWLGREHRAARAIHLNMLWFRRAGIDRLVDGSASVSADFQLKDGRLAPIQVH